MIHFIPLGDRVLIEPSSIEEKTASGIIIPDSAKEKPLQGTIVAVGQGEPDKPLTVAKGLDVLYGPFSGTEIKIKGKSYLLMREKEIYGYF